VALKNSDGEPPDFVDGAAVSDLHSTITELIEESGCD
jgi:hypothetical protein